MKDFQEKIDKMVSKILLEEIEKKSDEMNEKLHGDQDKLDVAEPKGKLTKADFKKLGDMKEEEDMEEAETEEGNAFTGALEKAKEEGEDSFEVDGKTYPVKESVKKKETKEEEEKWIQKTKMKKGALHKKLGVPEGDKIPKTKLKSLKKELMKKGEGDKKLSAADAKLLKQVNLALTLGGIKESNESLKLTENELVDFIEQIVLEQQTKSNIKVETPIGLREVEKSNGKTKKVSDEYVKSVTNKLKTYLKDGSKESFTMEPKHFPKGNGELAKMNKKAYKPSKAVDEYIENLAYPGLQNLDYDEIKPNEEWVESNLVGSSKTGNNNDWANADNTGYGKKMNDIRKKNLYSKEKKRSYKRVTQPVDQAGEHEGESSLDKMFAKLESAENKKDKLIKEDMDKMKMFINYNRKTQ